MNDKIYNIIIKTGKISLKKLIKKTGISEEEIKKIIKELKLDGYILELDNKYIPFPDDCYLGTIIETSSLRKYIEFNGQKIAISSDFYFDVILNDLVCFKLNQDNEADIVSIVDRPLSKMTCEVVNKNGKLNIIPYRQGIRVKLNKEDQNKLLDGDIILVSIPDGEIGEYYENKLIKKIGRRDDPYIQDRLIAINYGFDDDYSDEYLEEVSNMPNEVCDDDLNDRVDFRNQNCFTIDGKYTKDMDDGIYAEKLDNDIIRVYVHIADVSHYVKRDSLVFNRACEKGTSLYMNNSVFHMLHYIISNGICSLNPNVDRLTKTVIMDIDKDGKVINYDIVKSVINSKKKMVYDDVDFILNDMYIPYGYENFTNELKILNEAAIRLEKKYKLNGKIDFANTELSMNYNDDGTINSINEPVNSPASKLIENLMICANETVAKWLFYMEMPTIYRIHELPELKKINELISTLNKQGYNIKYINNVDNPESLQIVIDKLRNYEGFNTLSQLFVMTMKRARYSVDNLGHYALALPAYLHFTSPIRRLPDLVVHMMCDFILTGYQDLENIDYNNLETKLNELAVHASTMERLADSAEAEANKRLIIDKMDTLIGEELEATVCELGKKIRIKLFDIDTYIDCKKLGENFIFDSKRKQFFDINTNQCIGIGSKIIVRLTSVNKFNNSFKIKLLGTKNTNVKKKKLIKEPNTA